MNNKSEKLPLKRKIRQNYRYDVFVIVCYILVSELTSDDVAVSFFKHSIYFPRDFIFFFYKRHHFPTNALDHYIFIVLLSLPLLICFPHK